LLVACQPAPSAPTAAPAKPTEAAKPAAPAPAAPTAVGAPAAKPDQQAIADFYKGKTVRIVVGLAAGGGYDTYARLIARYLPNYLPGNPSVVVENQVGAGSLLAANSVYKTAPKDGTVMVHFIGGMITQKLVVQNPAVEFDPFQYNWLGAPTPDTTACVVRKESGFTSLEEARTRQLVMGGTAPGSTTDDTVNTLRAIGFNIKLVDGYDGTAKIRLAADSGEVMGGCWGWESITATWREALDKQEVVILGQGGAKPHPDIPNVPMILSLAKNDDERRLIQAGIVAPGQLIRPFAMPPGVPPERVVAMRDGLLATLKSPDLLAEAKKANLAINPISAEEFLAGIKSLQDLSPDLRQKLKAVLGTQ